MSRAVRLVELYDHGVITEAETLNQLYDAVELEDLKNLPDKWLSLILHRLNKLPPSDDVIGWSKLITIFGGAMTMVGPDSTPPPTQEEIQEQDRQRAKHLRQMFQNYVAGTSWT